MNTAKYRLTVLLPNEINYGHTIDEAEKVDAISNAMEEYAKSKMIEFYKFLEKEGKFPNSAGYANFHVDRFLNTV